MTKKENFACFAFSETWRHLGIAQTSLALLSVCTSFPCEDLFLVTGFSHWDRYLGMMTAMTQDLSPRLVQPLSAVLFTAHKITKFPPHSRTYNRNFGKLQLLVPHFCQILRRSQKKFVFLHRRTHK